MCNTPGFSGKKPVIEQTGVETFQRFFPQDPGKFCTPFNTSCRQTVPLFLLFWFSLLTSGLKITLLAKCPKERGKISFVFWVVAGREQTAEGKLATSFFAAEIGLDSISAFAKNSGALVVLNIEKQESKLINLLNHTETLQR